MANEESVQDGMGNEVADSGGSLVPIGGRTMQQVRTNYTTAMSVQTARSLPIVQKRFLEEARLMGEAAYYGWAAGKDRIEGPSQALAYAAARCWGNCAVDQQPIEETTDAWVFTSVFVDCETGFTLTRKFRQSKRWTVHGKLDAERKDDVRFQVGQTKGDRNVILKALPRWLIDLAMEEAKAGVRSKLEKYIEKHGLPAAIDYALKELAKVGVGEDRVSRKFSVAKKTALSVDNLVIIAGDIKAIQQGQEYPESLYPSEEAGDIADQLTKPELEINRRRKEGQGESIKDSEPLPDSDLVNEFCDLANQAATVSEVQQLIEQYATGASEATVTKVQFHGEVRIKQIRGARGERANQTTMLNSIASATEGGQ